MMYTPCSLLSLEERRVLGLEEDCGCCALGIVRLKARLGSGVGSGKDSINEHVCPRDSNHSLSKSSSSS